MKWLICLSHVQATCQGACIHWLSPLFAVLLVVFMCDAHTTQPTPHISHYMQSVVLTEKRLAKRERFQT
eukprot:235462-Amphidinium_carterae.1